MSMSRDPQREEFWRQAIAGWNNSGLSVRVYCSQRDLAEPSFYAWRRELAKRDRLKPAPLTFLPVQVHPHAIVEVVLPDGVLVRVPADVEAATVAALVAALRATPC